jgi:hypothetical protein
VVSAHSRGFVRARYAEATETLEALLQMPYRVARRSSNHTHDTGLLATDLGRIRLQLRLSGEWIAKDHDGLAEAFQSTLAIVEADVTPRLTRAWSAPDSSGAAWATASGDAIRAVTRWRRLSKMRFIPGRLLLAVFLKR